MLYILIIIFVIILILLVFLYSIWKQEDTWEENLQEEWEEQILKDIKKSKIDTFFFRKGLKDIKISEENILAIKKEISKHIIWLDHLVNSILINLLIGGNILVEWLPGLAKTKTIETLSKIMDMDFKRLQFTPDMLPSDITWNQIFNSKTQDFETKLWPVFSNLILADEINRTTPKVQSALLEAMQEKTLSIAWETFELPDPFFVLATQNPIENEWTYPLPEAQIDRFSFKVIVDYPSKDEEQNIIKVLEEEDVNIEKILTIKEFKRLKESIKNVKVSDDIRDYITRIVEKTREKDERVLYWASPRASINLFFASKALAYLQGRDYVDFEDIQRLILNVLRHRIILSYDAIVEWWSIDEILLEKISNVSLE